MDPGSGDTPESWTKPPARELPQTSGRLRRPADRMRLRRPWWAAATGVLIALGTLGTMRGADALSLNDAQRAHQDFVASSAGIATTLRLALVHEEDLAVSAGAFFAANPDATESEFLQWTRSVQAFARYRELLTISVVKVVPASDLHAYAARQEADPSASLGAGGAFVVTPAGSRPYYCFNTVIVSRSPQWLRPAGTDYCDNPIDQALLKSGDSGQIVYLPYGVGKVQALAVGNAIYGGGVVPATVQARRDALIGWTGTVVLPSVILHTALEDHPGSAVEFGYKVGSSDVTFGAKAPPAHYQSVVINLHNGWQVTIFGAVPHSGVLGNGGARVFLFGGLALSAMLGALIYLLGTSRSRALALVEERTNQLHHQAFHDSLTGLPSRALILDRMGQMLARAQRDSESVAVLFLDLDNFKDINDTLGHVAGDQLLVAVGARLSDTIRAQDTVGRLGGDEFIILTEASPLRDDAQATAARVLDAFSTPFEIADSDFPLVVTASIGISEGIHAVAEDLLRDADIAMYRAKAAGKRRAETFVPSMQAAIDDHRRLEIDLLSAIASDQFFVLYQPTFSLLSGALTGVEAVLRWNHPRRGLVLPTEFVPTLESTGLVLPVGRWVIDEACRQGVAWHRQGYRISVSVNVSAWQLEGDRIVEDVDEALQVSGFDPSMLILELTETALMQNVDATAARLRSLKALGVRLAIDDFGTGYSSLAYLQQFPIDVLKIDRSFVSGIVDTPKSEAIVRTLVELGKSLGIEVVAEGIENEDQRRLLAAQSVDTGQGFLFARPLDVAALDQLLAHCVTPFGTEVADAHAGVRGGVEGGLYSLPR